MSNDISKKYVKLTQREHILKRPDTYIGSIEKDIKDTFIPTKFEDDFKSTKMVYDKVEYSPGFLKIFDEILTNSSDHSIRTNSVSYIKVNINDNFISVENDGEGIPTVIHNKHKIYVSEMIFGNLLTGENYNDTQQRYGAGRNGIGAKATNIFSKKFTVETSDGKNKFIQKYTNNMSRKSKPTISKCNKSYTKITYEPDYEKFSMNSLEADSYYLMIKRVFDIAAYNPTVKVYLNDSLIPIRNFKDYMKLFIEEDKSLFYEKINDFWEIGVSESPSGSFTHVSMVNGNSTIVGGTHVNFISNNIINEVKNILTKSVKGINIKPIDVKNKMLIFVNCKLPNPTFDTQTKENLTLRLVSALTKGVDINSTNLRKIAKSDIFKDLIELSKLKEQLELQQELNKQKGTKRIKIDKLVDANNAGKLGRSKPCFLHLTEGLSAKSFIISGLGVIGKDNHGVYPLKGKPMNVRDTPMSKIKKNEEITDIIKAVGLEFGKKYTNTKSLRYDKIVMSCDSDVDGYHIKGLLLNMFNFYWPELLEIGFLYEFVTPILIASHGTRKKFFYRVNDYNKWKEVTKTANQYTIKYFKGLGTLGAKLSKVLFSDLDKHLIPMHYTNHDTTSDLIDLVFNKKRQDDRKEWLSEYTLNKKFDKFAQKTTFESFINNEFIEFSMDDNIRSIPSIMDGLKPSQRKILYTLFSMNKGEMNVGEVFGYVKAKAEYHHGPASLEQAIINLAQDYVGSNNSPLLIPNGSFGTRLVGGKDSAAPRYIYTELSKLTNTIFNRDDNNILNYLESDGKVVEPDFYLPTIPQILLNGADGIGTGWSTNIPNFKIDDIVEYIENKIKNKKKNIDLVPYYNDFKGRIYYDNNNGCYMTEGIITKKNETTLIISELPIGVWNDDYYKKVLDKLVDDNIIKSYQKNCTDVDVNIVIKLTRDLMSKHTIDSFTDFFHLRNKIQTTNMHLFDINGKIKKYETQYDIIDEFYDNRLSYYDKRKEYKLSVYQDKKEKLDDIMRFIDMYINKKIDINNKTLDEINKILEKKKFNKIENSFRYLLNIPIYKLSKDELDKVNVEYSELLKIIDILSSKDSKKLWLEDLSLLKKEIKKMK